MALLLDTEDPSVAGARRGDPLAWADLYERFHPVLARYLEVVDPDALEDLDARWAQAARDLVGQPEGVDPLIWLLRSFRSGLVCQPDPESAVDPAVRAIRSLEPVAMEVIALRVIAGLTDVDVAAVTGSSVHRVRSASHQGLARLVKLMDDA